MYYYVIRTHVYQWSTEAACPSPPIPDPALASAVSPPMPKSLQASLVTQVLILKWSLCFQCLWQSHLLPVLIAVSVICSHRNTESQGFQTSETSTMLIYLAQSLQSSAAVILTELTLDRNEHVCRGLGVDFWKEGVGQLNLEHLSWKTSFKWGVTRDENTCFINFRPWEMHCMPQIHILRGMEQERLGRQTNIHMGQCLLCVGHNPNRFPTRSFHWWI